MLISVRGNLNENGEKKVNAGKTKISIATKNQETCPRDILLINKRIEIVQQFHIITFDCISDTDLNKRIAEAKMQYLNKQI